MKKQIIAVVHSNYRTFVNYCYSREKDLPLDTKLIPVSRVEDTQGRYFTSYIELHDSQDIRDYHSVIKQLNLRIRNDT